MIAQEFQPRPFTVHFGIVYEIHFFDYEPKKFDLIWDKDGYMWCIDEVDLVRNTINCAVIQ